LPRRRLCADAPGLFHAPSTRRRSLPLEALRESGLAFLTPSTVTGQEEDKQTLAYVSRTALKSERPDIPLRAAVRDDQRGERAGLAGVNRTLYHEYRDTAVFDGAAMRQIAQAAGTRYLAQLKLATLQQGSRGRWSLLGFNILNTAVPNMRVFLQIWDSRDGSIAGKASTSSTLAVDTGGRSRSPSATSPSAPRRIDKTTALEAVEDAAGEEFHVGLA